MWAEAIITVGDIITIGEICSGAAELLFETRKGGQWSPFPALERVTN
jgi:hypothetical protein